MEVGVVAGEVIRWTDGRPVVDLAEDGEPCCQADSGEDSEDPSRLWLCTRPEGHIGDHQAAGLDGKMAASWPR